MSATKWTLVFLMVATAAISGAAQQRDAANLSVDFPVPAWPANGVVPPELKNNYVFVDPSKNQYIVAFPENLGSPNFEKDGPAERRVNRYPLQRDVDPTTAVSVTSSGGKYKYVYTVFNGPNAKGSLDQWALVLPPGTESSSLKQPANWFGLVQKGRKFAVTNPDLVKTGNAAVFSFSKSEGQIQPGAFKTGFELESELRPGFTVAYFRQTESVDATVQASGNIPSIVIRNATPPPPANGAPPPPGGGGGGGQIPPAALSAWQPVKDSIEKLLQFEYNSKTVLTLAPKFDKNATDKTVATDFVQGITILTRTGALAADSAFVKSALSDLDAYIKAGASGPLKLTAQPKSQPETDVFNALKLSLHAN